ncbi:uncharacterized protein B0T15DRAFT_397993 [Chaetomium strumarium]|uniref:C2H2-type domain-containing protein n=1 Tax=Chaetomium strumarium TaxID=1170767 RepID=A0AAJ0GSC1_9PEZI|nr:hypothetical protein B0T15DRAFT_397993 [Chaetomium strumarium]
MSGLPAPSSSYQNPVCPSLGAGSSQTSEPSLPWIGSPVFADSPMSHDGPNMPNEGLVNPFEGFDFKAMLDACSGDLDLSTVDLAPDHAMSMETFNNCLDTEMLASFDWGLGSDFLDPFGTPSLVGSESPVDSVLDFTSGTSSPLERFSPAPFPTAGTSPASRSPATSAPRQVHRCAETSCTKVFSRRSDLKKHERSTHRQPFRCHLQGCGKGHADQRALHRHFWTRHREYAELHNIPSERAKCPHCDYEGRGDNLKRHMKKHMR